MMCNEKNEAKFEVLSLNLPQGTGEIRKILSHNSQRPDRFKVSLLEKEAITGRKVRSQSY
jgi:hypothetical protein